MEAISNVDRLVVLLRRRLLERSKAAGSARKDKAQPGAESAGGIGLQALAGVEGVEDRQLKRALIQNILADQFGGEMLNEAKFQQMVDRVTEGLEGEAGSAKLLDRVVDELRASARG